MEKALNNSSSLTYSSLSSFSSSSLRNLLVSEKTNNGSQFTIRSKDSGKDFTYSISRHIFNGKWYTTVYVEKEYMNFVKLGIYFNGKIFNKKSVVETTSAKTIAWVLERVEAERFSFLDEKIEFLHLGKCILCGRTLTDSVSILHGLGSHCRNK
jgi:hypothetical protein